MQTYYYDNFVRPEICRAAVNEWPSDDWAGWVRYSGPQGEKYASRSTIDGLPPACRSILLYVAHHAPVDDDFGSSHLAYPDLTLHGSGMHMFHQGGHLPRHLDSDHNPVNGHRRVGSVILFLTGPQGGELVVGDKPIAPVPGRLAMFKCSDDSWHHVAPVIRGRRLSLSLFYWSAQGGAMKRPRAQWELPQPEKNHADL